VLLRRFRDEVLLGRMNRYDLVSAYYREAPSLIAKLNAVRPGWKSAAFADYLRPAIDAIREGGEEHALDLYCRMVETLRTWAMGVDAEEQPTEVIV
jgi:hypothetical protein